MDLTLFAVTRAVDVLVGELWAQRKARRIAAGRWTKVCFQHIVYVQSTNHALVREASIYTQ